MRLSLHCEWLQTSSLISGDEDRQHHMYPHVPAHVNDRATSDFTDIMNTYVIT